MVRNVHGARLPRAFFKDCSPSLFSLCLSCSLLFSHLPTLSQPVGSASYDITQGPFRMWKHSEMVRDGSIARWPFVNIPFKKEEFWVRIFFEIKFCLFSHLYSINLAFYILLSIWPGLNAMQIYVIRIIIVLDDIASS